MNHSRAQQILFFLVYVFLIVLSVSITIRNQIYHGELDIYLPHYLSERTVPQIIFDPICELDLSRTQFRGREVGNFFNYLDAHALALIAKVKLPGFISIVGYLCIILIAALTLRTAKALGGPILLPTYLSVALLLSSPPIVFSGIFYRTNKIIASLGLLTTFFILVLRLHQKHRQANISPVKPPLYLLFLVSFLSCLTDEQALVFIGLIFFWLLIVFFWTKLRPTHELIAIFGAMLTCIAYKAVVGPLLFEEISGIIVNSPNFSLSDFYNFENFVSSVKLLGRYFTYLAGNITGGSALVKTIYLSALFYFGYLCLRGTSRALRLKVLITVLASVMYISLVIHMMTTKHPAIFWNDIVTYYSLPIVTIIFLTFLMAIQYATANGKVSAKGISFVLSILIVLNIISLPRFNSLINEGHLRHFKVADSVIQAIYTDANSSTAIVKSLRLKEVVPGALPNVNYTENGVRSLRTEIGIER